LNRGRLADVAGLAAVSLLAPTPASAHAPCRPAENLSGIGIGAVVGVLLFRPWRATAMSMSARLARLLLPIVLATVLVSGACSPKSTKRPTTQARLQILQPTPGQVTGADIVLRLRLIGARVVKPAVGRLRGDEGHIHVSLDGKLVSMTYGTTQPLDGLTPGSHSIRAEFVATDHLPFANRVIAVVLFTVQ
jgi:hypothetical protein